ncbi:error-prone DNA polymerase [Aestuariivirga sp.]|jgi:error-prone DNA polymerase|uniref:error-prone DNA polymerase n=1 Tax=Aestuariivirga sp. TaxID=2650926 RepID=UPI003783A6D6
MTAYAELQCASNFSFLRGASHPEELAAQARHLGLAALALTDRNTLAGVVRAHAAARDAGISFIVGARLDLVADGLSFLAYPADRAAYGRLCRLLSLGQRRAEKGQCLLTLEDVHEHAEGMIFALLADGAGRLAEIRQRLKAPLYLAASHHYGGNDRARLNRLAELAHRHRTEFLATNDVLYHHASRRIVQDVVSAIREGVAVAQAGQLLEANAERHLKTPEEMARLFRDHPQAIANTLAIAGACRFSLDELRYEYPEEPVPPGTTPQAHLAHLAWEGAARRYPQGIPPKVGRSITRELELIGRLNYAPYFLTVHDIVQFARSQDPPILCQGRGSAANSAVCYAIGITAVDPGEIELLFERFISEERKEPPDIDVDFEHERRELVIQYIYARYGRERAGLAATVISYRGRSALREVGKAMGLSEDVTAALAGIVWGRMSEEMQAGRLKEAGLDPDDPLLARVIELADELQGFPRHLSQHVGGFVLTKGRLDETVPIGNAAMAERTFIEWDKDDIDTLGILKIDVLALGMLTCIQKSFGLIAAWYGLRYELATLPREDAAVYDMLCKADSVGVFQVESRAQMNMLPRLRPRCFYDLVIEVAIVRPGPIQGDMVHPYLRRRDGLEPEDYPAPHPDFGPPDELRQVLGRTRGVPLFQEQAMKLAMVAAEFTAGELNELRKAMATFRRRGTIGRLEQKMVNRMVERGYDAAFAARCFSQIKGFGEYGFPESHAASFAHLVYVSAWLKRHYPEVFAAALLNSQPMGFYAPAQIVRDAREHGVEVRPVDITFSEWDSTLEEPASNTSRAALRLGLREVEGLRLADGLRLVEVRTRSKNLSIAALHAAGVPAAGLEKLAAADCFRSLGLDRRAALWEVKALSRSDPLPLFAFAQALEQGAEPSVALPAMPLSEHVVNDYQTVKLSLKAHPMQFLRGRCEARKVTDNDRLKALRNGAAVSVAGVVLVRQRPGSAKGVVFVTLEDEFSVCNAVIWPQVLESHRAVVMGARLMLIRGRVQRTGGIIHVVAQRIEDCSDWLALLSEEGQSLKTSLARADEVVRPGPEPYRQVPPARHPRQQRVIPKSRDFH